MVDNKKIVFLFTEDNAGHAMLMRKNLNQISQQHEIHFVENGRDAIDFLLRAGKFENLIIPDSLPTFLFLDISLPVMDGFEVLKVVRSNKKISHTPIIILTTSKSQKEINLCYELGCNLFFSKPINYEEFCQLLHQVINLLLQVECPQRA